MRTSEHDAAGRSSCRARRGRRAIPVLAALALGVVVAVVGVRGRQLWWTWCRWEARKACLKKDFDERHPGASWATLLESAPESYPQLAALLTDPDLRVWFRASETIDVALPFEPFLDWARAEEPAAALAYLLQPPYCDPTLWRDDGIVEGVRDPSGYGYWSGRCGQPLEPFDSGLRFLNDVVSEEGLVELQTVPFSPGISVLRKRAIRALAAMLVSGETDTPGSESARRIRALIERVARTDPDATVRFEAVGSLLRRSSAWSSAAASEDPRTPTLEEWEQVRCELLHGPALYQDGIHLLGVGSPRYARLLEPFHLRGILHLDHPRTLAILDALRQHPEFREAIAVEQARAQPLGALPLPDWEPLEAVRRHLREDPGSRALAALFVARKNLRSAIPDLKRALEIETRADLQIVERACLCALGDASQRDAVVAKLHAVMDHQREEESLGYIQHWEDPPDYELSLHDLAAPLLWAGDREVLGWVARHYDLNGWPYLEDHVDRLPDGLRDAHRCGNPFLASFDSDPEALEKRVRGWWEAHGDAVTWDPQRRRFVAPP